MFLIAASSKKHSAKQAKEQLNIRSVNNEEFARLFKIAIANAIKEKFPTLMEEVVAQLSAKTQARVAIKSERASLKASNIQWKPFHHVSYVEDFPNQFPTRDQEEECCNAATS